MSEITLKGLCDGDYSPDEIMNCINNLKQEIEILTNFGGAIFSSGTKLFSEISQLKQELATYKEKDTPKKPKQQEWAPALCPNCKAELSEHEGDGYYKHFYSLKICECGQKLKWK